MKFIVLILAMIGFSFSGFAQGAPYSTSQEQGSQLWNITNSYRNSVVASNLGTQRDTGTNATSFQIGTARWGTGKVNDDTFTYAPFNGDGRITLTANLLKCTGTPLVTVSYMSSSDGINWAPIPSVASDTVTLTSLTVPVTFKKTFIKSDFYFGIKFGGSSSSTYSTQGQIYYIKGSY